MKNYTCTWIQGNYYYTQIDSSWKSDRKTLETCLEEKELMTLGNEMIKARIKKKKKALFHTSKEDRESKFVCMTKVISTKVVCNYSFEEKRVEKFGKTRTSVCALLTLAQTCNQDVEREKSLKLLKGNGAFHIELYLCLNFFFFFFTLLYFF